MSTLVSRTFTLPRPLLDEVISRASKRDISVDELVVQYLNRAMSNEDFQERNRQRRALIRSLPSPRVKLMPDIGAPPLWDAERGGPIPLETLPLSSATVERLERWRSTYETYFAREGKYLEQQADSTELDAFEHEGLALWQLLREELAGKYSVIYQSSRSHDLIVHPDDVGSSGQA